VETKCQPLTRAALREVGFVGVAHEHAGGKRSYLSALHSSRSNSLSELWTKTSCHCLNLFTLRSNHSAQLCCPAASPPSASDITIRTFTQKIAHLTLIQEHSQPSQPVNYNPHRSFHSRSLAYLRSTTSPQHTTLTLLRPDPQHTLLFPSAPDAAACRRTLLPN
jgi:hypothetical protein